MPKLPDLPAEVPGPPPHPKWGASYHHAKFLRDPTVHMMRLYEEYGPVVAIANPGMSIVFVFGAEHNRHLLRDPSLFHSIGLTVHGPMGSAQRRISTNSLFSMNASQNRDRRAMLMPPMHQRVFDNYHDSIVDATLETVASWEGKQTTDLFEDMKRLAMSVAGRCLFGVDLPAEFPEMGPLLEYWFDINCSVAVRLSDEQNPSAAYRRMLKVAERLEAMIKDMLDMRMKMLDDSDEDLMSILLRAHRAGKVGYPELVGQANILLMAAYDTSSGAMTWMHFLLEQHPDVLAAVVDELSDELGGDPPRPDQLNKLPLLERAIKESMRVLGPAVHNTRINIRPATFGDYELPRGSNLVFSHFVTHRVADVYPEPNRFLPSRWETINPSPYEYLPFGAGPRMCIGAAFAMMTMKIAMGTMLQRHRFELLPAARIDRKVATTLTPKYGLPVRLHRQDRAFAAGPVRGNIHDIVNLPSRERAAVS